MFDPGVRVEDPTAIRKRTTPTSWGDWPPEQEQITAVVERAARALAERFAADPKTEKVVLLALPKPPKSLDCCFSGQEKEIVVGYIWSIGKRRRWTVLWNPATDAGRISDHGYDYRA